MILPIIKAIILKANQKNGDGEMLLLTRVVEVLPNLLKILVIIVCLMQSTLIKKIGLITVIVMIIMNLYVDRISWHIKTYVEWNAMEQL